jgi:putative endonuclease
MSTRVKRPGAKQRTGAFGELKTAEFVTARGDEILDRNWRIKEGEIDLISLSVMESFTLLRSRREVPLPLAIPSKQSIAIKLIGCNALHLAWLATHGCLGCEYAIDVVAILIASDGSHTLEYRGGIL